MNKTLLKPGLIAAAVLAAAPLAQAQSSVTIYGRVDLGVQHMSKTVGVNAPANVNAGSLTELFNGGIRPSIFGFRGTEDLGSGTSAFFNLEGHFDAGTGQGVNLLFRRQANVGIKSGFGSVTLGRQYSPALLAHLDTEPRAFKEQFSMLYTHALNQTAAGGANDIGVFLGNAVSYSNNFGPVYVGLAYAFGEQVSSTSNGSTVAAGASYKGPVNLSASYQRIKLNTGAGDTTQYGLGASLPVGAFTIKSLFQRTESDIGVLVPAVALPPTPARATKVDTWGLGVDWAWNSSNTATVAYYLSKDKELTTDRTKTLVVSNDYALSKRTTLYAQLAYADADPNASIRTSVIATPGLRGLVQNAKTAVYGVGVKHDF